MSRRSVMSSAVVLGRFLPVACVLTADELRVASVVPMSLGDHVRRPFTQARVLEFTEVRPSSKRWVGVERAREVAQEALENDMIYGSPVLHGVLLIWVCGSSGGLRLWRTWRKLPAPGRRCPPSMEVTEVLDNTSGR